MSAAAAASMHGDGMACGEVRGELEGAVHDALCSFRSTRSYSRPRLRSAEQLAERSPTWTDTMDRRSRETRLVESTHSDSNLEIYLTMQI